MSLIRRRGFSVVALFLLGAFAHAGNVTATFPLPKPSSVDAIQQDAAGNIYLAGNTGTTLNFTSDPAVSSDAFVAKLSSTGTVLFWTTFGGSKADGVRAMAIASDGSITVVGSTASLDFPLTPDAAQTQFVAYNQNFTGFFVHLDGSGNVRYSSYLNSNYSDSFAPFFYPTGLTLDAAGAAYINGVGSIVSTSGALPMVLNGGWVMKLDASGKIVFGTGAIGGKVSLDRQGFIYIVGASYGGPGASSFALPVTPGAFQATVINSTCSTNDLILLRCSHQYVVKLDPSASKVIYATWISGTLGDSVGAAAVDDAGNVTVAGATSSRDYPVTPGAYQRTNFATLPLRDITTIPPHQPPLELPVTGYVTKLNSTGTGLIFSTYLGGSSMDSIRSIATDSAGRAYLGGIALSVDFPGLPVVPEACRPSYVYPVAFVARLSPDGSSLTETQLAFGLTPSTSARIAPQALGVVGLVALDGQGKAAAQMGGALVTLDLFATPSPLVCTTDAANFAPLNSVAPGQLLSLFGESIGPNVPVQAQPQDGFIPVSLAFGGISVTFNGVPAPLLYASSGQVNVQVPYEVADLASVTMKIQNGTATSTAVFSVVPSQPSAFVQAVRYASCYGEIRESLLPVASNADGSLTDCANKAQRGTFVNVFLNGLGLAGGHPRTGAISTTSDAPPIVGVAALNPLYPGFSTEPVPVTAIVDQINSVWQAKIAIPLASPGPSLQLALTVNGVAARDSLVLWLK
jgi:uncharacterized protein (TIGR03437 family)